jgi:hypothetical protein
LKIDTAGQSTAPLKRPASADDADESQVVTFDGEEARDLEERCTDVEDEGEVGAASWENSGLN